MSLGDRGKWAEAEVQKWLTQYSSRHVEMAWHRYPDARAARGALAAQPADFLVSILSGSDPWVSHLEVKETENANRLPRGKISQFGMLYKFHLTGWDTFVLVYRSSRNNWTFFNKHELFDLPGGAPTSFLFVSHRDFRTAADALDFIYGA
jgi:hypothetical protein